MENKKPKKKLFNKETVEIETIKPKVPKPFNPLAMVSLKDIYKTQYKEINYYVKPFLPEGLTIYGGKPKLGKSFFALQLGVTIALGLKLMKKFPCRKSTVYYLSYEDNPRRIQNRIKKMFPKGFIPENFLMPKRPEKFPKLNKGGLECIKQIVEERPDIGVIIVDTLGRFIDKSSYGNLSFSGDYDAISPLQELAIKKHICIMLIHHTTKRNCDDPMDELQGTVGIQASPDGLMVMRKIKGNIELAVKGRDYEQTSYWLKFNKLRCRWNLIGDIRLESLTPEALAVLKIFKKDPKKSFTLQDIFKITKDKFIQNTENKIKRLVDKDLIIKDSRNCYKLDPGTFPEYINNDNDPNEDE